MSTDFLPPGPGFWQLDRSHFPGGTTPIMRSVMTNATESAFRKIFSILGIPADTLSMRFVNGFCYTRLRPLMLADRPSAKSPPAFILRIISRLHPEFRRRTKAAQSTLERSPAPPVIEEWRSVTRPRLVAQNLEFQGVNFADLNDEGLAAYLDALLAHIRWSYEEHFRLHGYDLGPIGQLIMAARDWGIPSSEVVGLLAGASPSTSAPMETLAGIREGLSAAGADPSSLEEVAGVSPEIAEELAGYLQHRGAVLYAGYDLDSPTLGESPGVVLATILADPASNQFDKDGYGHLLAELRARIPGQDQGCFEELLDAAREAMDLRDDNGPVTGEWPAGLLRLGMLEAGRRLEVAGRLHDREHVFELDAAELLELVECGTGPMPDELETRAKHRQAQKALNPPLALGDPEAPPPLEALPEPLAEAVTLVLTVIAELGMAEHEESNGDGGLRLSGTGIGTELAVGIARVAENADEAFDRLEPGEILVTRATSPAFNMVLTLVGGLVTAEGGPMCHAAVLSRELNISAVIGAPDAMVAIADGDLVEVDPVSARVRVLSAD